MSTYEFQCTSDACGGVSELVQSMTLDLPVAIRCKFCDSDATFMYSRQSIGHTGHTPSKTPFDVAVGHYSEARWKDIEKRQAGREKVRVASGQVGLRATDFKTFEPISDRQRQIRTKALNTIEKRGYPTIGSSDSID